MSSRLSKHRSVLLLSACVALLLFVIFQAAIPSDAEEKPSEIEAIFGEPNDVLQNQISIEPLASDHWVLLIHGGAGVMSPESMNAESAAEYRAGLERALLRGQDILSNGGSSLDAVTEAVVLLEDDPQFNAGRGSVFNIEAEHELDASIMDGEHRNAGAVAGVKRVRNPIRAARAIMDNSEHVMLAGEGADMFAELNGLQMTSNSFFSTDHRRVALERALKDASLAVDKRGTVGAVAIDMNGHLAAATSTGGMSGKLPGRVGDSPILGAGNYADDFACAVSATGHGEYFMRIGVAHRICAMMEFGELSPANAAQSVIKDLGEMGGDGGVIVISPDGRGAFVFNTPGMFRGYVNSSGEMGTAIYPRSKVD